jgi:uncharacterized protein YdaU (DUF1376 family)
VLLSCVELFWIGLCAQVSGEHKGKIARLNYMTERPIPADMRMICHLTRASTHPSSASHRALQVVLDSYFSLDTSSPSGAVYRHKRIDRELTEMARISNQYKARAKKGAEGRWTKERASPRSTTSLTTLRQP